MFLHKEDIIIFDSLIVLFSFKCAALLSLGGHPAAGGEVTRFCCICQQPEPNTEWRPQEITQLCHLNSHFNLHGCTAGIRIADSMLHVHSCSFVVSIFIHYYCTSTTFVCSTPVHM